MVVARSPALPPRPASHDPNPTTNNDDGPFRRQLSSWLRTIRATGTNQLSRSRSTSERGRYHDHDRYDSYDYTRAPMAESRYTTRQSAQYTRDSSQPPMTQRTPNYAFVRHVYPRAGMDSLPHEAAPTQPEPYHPEPHRPVVRQLRSTRGRQLSREMYRDDATDDDMLRAIEASKRTAKEEETERMSRLRRSYTDFEMSRGRRSERSARTSYAPKPGENHVDEDEGLRRAIRESLSIQPNRRAHTSGNDDEDAELKRAIEESRREWQEAQPSADGWHGWRKRKLMMEKMKQQQDMRPVVITGADESDEDCVRINPEVDRKSLRRASRRPEVFMSGALGSPKRGYSKRTSHQVRFADSESDSESVQQSEPHFRRSKSLSAPRRGRRTERDDERYAQELLLAERMQDEEKRYLFWKEHRNSPNGFYEDDKKAWYH